MMPATVTAAEALDHACRIGRKLYGNVLHVDDIESACGYAVVRAMDWWEPDLGPWWLALKEHVRSECRAEIRRWKRRGFTSGRGRYSVPIGRGEPLEVGDLVVARDPAIGLIAAEVLDAMSPPIREATRLWMAGEPAVNATRAAGVTVMQWRYAMRKAAS
jgi:hypothetical protein